MSNNLHNQIRSTVRRALYGTLGIPMLALPVALAQQATNQTVAATGEKPVKMEKTVVTGSLIPTAETVGPAPVDVVSADSIQKIGTADVLQTLKRITPDLAGNGNTGQEVNNGGTGESYIQLRNLRTLVLLNGRRLGNSSFSNGSLVDLNTIPISAIDHIEILKDGASAQYGSEAVGGVVNIITKKNFSGVEIGGRYGFGADSGTFTEHQVSVVGGTANDKASFMGAFQYYHRDPLSSSSRKIASLSPAELEANNLVADVSYLSPSFPGKVQDSTGAYILKSSPLLKGFTDPAGAPLYNPNAPASPPLIPNPAGGFKTFSGATAVRDYNNDP